MAQKLSCQEYRRLKMGIYLVPFVHLVATGVPNE